MRRDSTRKREDVYIHHIIASLFVPNPNHYPEVNHKDANPLNNTFSNLEWCTHKYNLEYGFKFGNKARNKKGQFTHKQYGIVYSPNKYRETEGIKDIGLNDWNQGRTQEIKERYVHLGGDN